MERQLSVSDYLAIAKRRKWCLVIPALVGPVLALAVCSSMPRRYTSQTLVLVQEQRVSEALIKPVVSEDLDRRLSTMKEQIFSRTRLEPIMQRFGLYKEELQKKSMDDLLEEMRRNIDVAPIRANGATPGFFISFTGPTPKLAQDVCAEISSMFMEENLKEREARSVGTTSFLQSQLDESKRNLDEQDAKLAAFQRKYAGQLPGQEQMNMSVLVSLKSQLDAVNQALDRAQQDKSYSESLLAQQKSAWETAHANSSHTEVPIETADTQLTQLKTQLAMLQSRYTDNHPDVVKTKALIARMEEASKAPVAVPKQQSKTETPGKQPYSPEMQRLQDNVYRLAQTIGEKTREQERLQAEIREYEARIQLSPTVEQEFKQLTRDYQSAQNFYQDLLNRKSQSEMATDLERRQEGEQFLIMDPANYPLKASFPDQKKFVGAGFAGGLGLGLGIAFLLEFFSRAIRSEADVDAYLKFPVLVSIPETGVPRHPGSERTMGGGNARKLKQLLGIGA